MGTVALPTKKHVAETGWPDIATWLLYGPPKVGKTEFLSQWPECLILNTEPRGTRYVEGAYVLDIESLKHLRETFLELKAKLNAKQLPYKTIAIDVIDVVVDWIYDEVMEEFGIKEMGQATKGSDWIAGKNRAITLIKQFGTLPLNVIFSGHSKPVSIGEKIVGATIDLSGSLPRAVMGVTENLLLCSFDKMGARKLVLKPSAGIDAGSHNPVIARATSCDLSYAALRGLFKE